MASFVVISRYKPTVSPADTRQLYQEAHDYFAKWSPPEGAQLVDVFLGIDQRTIVSVLEATHEAMAVVTAHFTPWMDVVEIIPVASAETVIGSLVKGGLITAPGS